MIKINKSDILNEFYILFPDVKKDAQTFCIASDLSVLNNGFEYSDVPFYSLPLSIMTYITVKITNDGIFKIRFSDNDKEYLSSDNELLSYTKNDEIKEIFNAISLAKQNITGACILFSYDTASNIFKNNVPAIFLAFSIINSKKLPSPARIDENPDTSQIKSNRNCLIYGRKNCLVSSDISGNLKYYPFNLQKKKIVLASFDKNPMTIKKNLLDALNENKNPCNFHQSGDFLYDSAKKYVLNERERTYSYINNGLTYSSLKSSSYELSEFLKPSENIKKLLDSSYYTSFSHFSFISLKYSAVASVVNDENVDNFIDIFRDTGEKIIGKELSFYITDSKDSGIELF